MKKALIVHGWTYSTEKYKKIAQFLTNRGINAKILKVPGLTEKIDRPWTIDDYVEWLKNKITAFSPRRSGRRSSPARQAWRQAESHDSFEVDSNKAMKQFNNKLILIGHSNGGRIAATFASIYPQRVDRLVLIDSAGILHDELHVKLRLFLFSTLARLGKKVSSSVLLKNLLYRMTGESDYNNATHLMKKTMTNLIKTDLALNLTKITTPTLIIWGEHDKVTPLNDGKVMHKLIPHSKLYIVKGAKHSPHFTHVTEVTEIILKYLKTQNAKVNPSADGQK